MSIEAEKARRKTENMERQTHLKKVAKEEAQAALNETNIHLARIDDGYQIPEVLHERRRRAQTEYMEAVRALMDFEKDHVKDHNAHDQGVLNSAPLLATKNHGSEVGSATDDFQLFNQRLKEYEQQGHNDPHL